MRIWRRLQPGGVIPRARKAQGHRNAMPLFLVCSESGFGDQEVVFGLAGSDGFSHPLGSYATTGPGLSIGVAVLGFDLDAGEFGRTLGGGLVCSRLANFATGPCFVLSFNRISILVSLFAQTNCCSTY